MSQKTWHLQWHHCENYNVYILNNARVCLLEHCWWRFSVLAVQEQALFVDHDQISFTSTNWIGKLQEIVTKFVSNLCYFQKFKTAELLTEI
jgi:hypothetical protein